jgi:lysyl-tRNA synthetase class II
VYESQFEEELYKLRREKLRQIGELGQKSGLSFAAATYPNSYATTITIPELRAMYDAMTAENFAADLAVGKKIEVSVAGRIMAIRVQGKAGFAQLQQNGARMQLYVRKDDVGEDAFALYKLLDLGDHIGARGYLFRTRTGELTVHVSSLTFLAKAMLALPDKFHGLEDTELRYRQRYVDLFVNPEVREVFVKRAARRPSHSRRTTMRSILICRCASHRSFTSSASSSEEWTASTRSTATSATRASPPSTTPSSPCWSSTRPTRTITT